MVWKREPFLLKARHLTSAAMLDLFKVIFLWILPWWNITIFNHQLGEVFWVTFSFCILLYKSKLKIVGLLPGDHEKNTFGRDQAIQRYADVEQFFRKNDKHGAWLFTRIPIDSSFLKEVMRSKVCSDIRNSLSQWLNFKLFGIPGL